MSDFSYALDVFIWGHFWMIFIPLLIGLLAILAGILRTSGRAFQRVSRRQDFIMIQTTSTYADARKPVYEIGQASEKKQDLSRYVCGEISADCRKPGCFHSE